MSEFISIRDLIEQVKKDLPERTPIPSETTVTFAFAPPTIHATSPQYYTEKINLKDAIQRRQLGAFHIDAHCCKTLFRYMREMIIKYQEDSLFLLCNDKAKIDYGEPGHALSTGVRGRKSIVPTTSTLGALDHDVNQKGSLTPTVTLACKISESVDESFYSGQVFVTLKDSVFQPSTSFQSTLELYESIQLLPSLTDAKRLFMVTDGGSEHNVSHESVKIPLILLFLWLNLDMLVAIRTAPGHSYRNSVERTMSILNIGFQNVSLERAAINQEEIIKKMKNLEDLRKVADKIKSAWIDSVQPLIDLLGDSV